MHYISLILFIALTARIRKASLAIANFYLILLIIFAMLTMDGSWDYYGYVEYYECSISVNCNNIGFERSFVYISKAANFISANWGLELTLMTYIAASLYIKIKLIKNHAKAFGVVILSFACHAYFIHDLTQLRASLAIAITWIAYYNWSQENKIKSVILIIFAGFIHVSAAIGLITLLSNKVSEKTLLILTIPAIFIGQYMHGGGLSILPTQTFARLDIYLSAIGSEVFTTPQFNFYAIVMSLICCIAIKNGLKTWTKFERLGIKSILLGLIVYFSMYFLPTIPVRLLEFFTSLYPFVVGATYISSRSKIEKIGIILTFLALFSNTAIKNNTRMDLIFPWQSINYDYMTDLQLEQFIRFSN